MSQSHGSERISKACEPCRAKKIRCNGEQPCSHCAKKPAGCLYRARPRNRKRLKGLNGPLGQSRDELRSMASPAFDGHTTSAEEETDFGDSDAAARQKVFHGVVATHRTTSETAEALENCQLFYGPSSNFAFLQQLHRGVLYSHSQTSSGDLQEGGPGLDMFLQRELFFGTPSKADNGPITFPAKTALPEQLTFDQARCFLEEFKATFWHMFPFFSGQELDDHLNTLYSDQGSSFTSSQMGAVFLSVLASGATCTAHTDIAEEIFIRAKNAAFPYDDAVTLSMIQCSLLLMHYQLHMGRPNSSYLYLGVACRKAEAMGLHRRPANASGRHSDQQKQRSTIWSLYFHEKWLGLTLGRKCAFTKADMTTPYPEEQPALVAICNLAHIVEDGTTAVYGRRYDSLRQLYLAAEDVHGQLLKYAEHMGLGAAATSGTRLNENPIVLLQLHNLYYNAILLTYRPFLVAEAALQSSAKLKGDQMWLRHACRHAIDAAQDLIVYCNGKFDTSPRCKVMRYAAFFLECACAVLLYDMLWHPSKRHYNLEYINQALNCLESMVQDEPVASALPSLHSIVRAVETAISRQSSSTTCRPTPQFASALPSAGQQAKVCPNVQFPWLPQGNSTATDQLIHFNGLPDLQSFDPNQLTDVDASEGMGADFPAQQVSQFNFDVLTTDLYNFFPVNMTTPSEPPGYTD